MPPVDQQKEQENEYRYPRCAAPCVGDPGLALAYAATASARTLPPIDALAAAPAARSAVSAVAAINDGTLQVDARFGVPTFLWGNTASAALKSAQRAPSAKALLDEEATARAYLSDVADLYQITAPEVAALQIHNLQRFPNGGAVVRFRNQVDGVEVFREQVNVLLDKTGGLTAIGGFAMGAPQASARARKSSRRHRNRRSRRRSPTTDFPRRLPTACSPSARTAATRCSRSCRAAQVPTVPRSPTTRVPNACGSGFLRGSSPPGTSKCRCATATGPTMSTTTRT